MLEPPDYREFAPTPALAGLIECFWTSTGRGTPERPSTHRVLPDGCMDLLFDFTAGASIIGTMTRSRVFTTASPIDLLGVRFRPGALSAVLPLDAAECTDARPDLANFCGNFTRELWQRLGEAAPEVRIAALGDLVRSRATEPDLFVRHCVARIEAGHGALNMAALERTTGLSARQLERKFARHVGISPKAFARIVRFKAVTAAARNAPDWAGLAAAFGFADQPHLVREFKALSGLTPSAYLRERVGFLQDRPGRVG